MERSIRNETLSVLGKSLGIPFGKIRGKQNRRAGSGDLEGCSEQVGKVALDAEGFACAPTTESRRIQNDRVKGFPAIGETAQVGRNILRDETVAIERKGIEFKISPPALEEGFRDVHTDGLRADAGGGD